MSKDKIDEVFEKYLESAFGEKNKLNLNLNNLNITIKKYFH